MNLRVAILRLFSSRPTSRTRGRKKNDEDELVDCNSRCVDHSVRCIRVPLRYLELGPLRSFSNKFSSAAWSKIIQSEVDILPKVHNYD